MDLSVRIQPVKQDGLWRTFPSQSSQYIPHLAQLPGLVQRHLVARKQHMELDTLLFQAGSEEGGQVGRDEGGSGRLLRGRGVRQAVERKGGQAGC